ncbi:hypothetical protein FIBSPDRAFT_885234 [Athelia psychrophila]|uniref:Uncharacterized protein n=1 Tax=Athelia psychrophila TaxID=1759441 RepID=A0A166S8G9_9AGAM|nr:hypothetical protein FIBSPDRAFT_885234 [Fibularhizoctonia sp. CBS 109695]
MLPDDPLIVPVAPNFKFIIWWHHRNGHICSPTGPIKIWVPDSDSPQNSGSGEVYCPTTGMPISVHPGVQLRFGDRIRTLLKIPLLPPESPVTVATGTQSKNRFQIRILWKIPLLVIQDTSYSEGPPIATASPGINCHRRPFWASYPGQPPIPGHLGQPGAIPGPASQLGVN